MRGLQKFICFRSLSPAFPLPRRGGGMVNICSPPGEHDEKAKKKTERHHTRNTKMSQWKTKPVGFAGLLGGICDVLCLVLFTWLKHTPPARLGSQKWVAGCRGFVFTRTVSDIYASTDSLHVLDLIGSDYTAFGIDCTAYLFNVSSDMYEYDTSTRLIRVQFIVQPSLEIATCLVYLSSWLRRLLIRALPSGPTALNTGRRDRTGIFVFVWCDVRLK